MSFMHTNDFTLVRKFSSFHYHGRKQIFFKLCISFKNFGNCLLLYELKFK